MDDNRDNSSGRLRLEDLDPAYQAQLTTQEYTSKRRIDGVKIIDLRLMNDDGGSFAELARFDTNGFLEAVPGFQVRQTSYSVVLPGAIKAFHLHYGQDDVWFVPPTDRLLIGLIDARDASETKSESMRFVMGAGRAQLLFIPRGVGHGCANIGNTPSTVLYFVNQQFNLEDPDERRLPWDMLGEAFWKVTHG